METKLERIAEISASSPRPEFTSLYHLINKEMLLQCHKELDGSKAVGIDEITKKEYERNLEQNIDDLVKRLKRKSYKPQPSIRVYIPKSNGKLRPLGIACCEDKIVQLALKKILEAVYEPRFLNCMYGFRPNRGCHGAIKELYKRLNNTKICYIMDADIKGFFDHMKYDWIIRFLNFYIKDPNIIGLVKNYLKVGVLDDGDLMQSGACIARAKQKRGESTRLETFDFLGVTFYCGRSRKGVPYIMPKTSSKKFRQKIRDIKVWLYANRDQAVKKLMGMINLKLIGHYRYYGISFNGRMISNYKQQVRELLFKVLNRRSDRKSYTREGFIEMLKYYPLAMPKIYVSLF